MTSQMKKAKPYKSIEAMRFLCMLIICYWHCFQQSDFLGHGNLAVEWFFILSGFLLYGSYTRHPEEGTLDFTLRKYIRFAPEYLLVLAFCYFRYTVAPALVGHNAFDPNSLLKAVPESLMIQDIGFYGGGLNHPLWYVCVLLCGGAFVHSMLKNYGHKAISLFLPIIVVLGYTFIYEGDGKGHYLWDVVGIIKINLLRGVCSMSLGVLLAHFMERKKEMFVNNRLSIDVISLFGLVLFFALFFVHGMYLPYGLIATCFMLVGCFQENSILNRCFSWSGWILLGSLSWEMLIIHARVSIPIYESLIAKLPAASAWGWAIYFVVVVISAYTLRLANNLLSKLLHRL